MENDVYAYLLFTTLIFNFSSLGYFWGKQVRYFILDSDFFAVDSIRHEATT